MSCGVSSLASPPERENARERKGKSYPLMRLSSTTLYPAGVDCEGGGGVGFEFEFEFELGAGAGLVEEAGAGARGSSSGSEKSSSIVGAIFVGCFAIGVEAGRRERTAFEVWRQVG